jgi:hypothetical protein
MTTYKTTDFPVDSKLRYVVHVDHTNQDVYFTDDVGDRRTRDPIHGDIEPVTFDAAKLRVGDRVLVESIVERTADEDGDIFARDLTGTARYYAPQTIVGYAPGYTPAPPPPPITPSPPACKGQSMEPKFKAGDIVTYVGPSKIDLTPSAQYNAYDVDETHVYFRDDVGDRRRQKAEHFELAGGREFELAGGRELDLAIAECEAALAKVKALLTKGPSL